MKHTNNITNSLSYPAKSQRSDRFYEINDRVTFIAVGVGLALAVDGMYNGNPKETEVGEIISVSSLFYNFISARLYELYGKNSRV